MTVQEVMTPQAEVISPDATIEEAASVMKQLDIGVLPVCDEAGLVGILTDRDVVVRAVAMKRDPKGMLVGEAMTPSVVYCFEQDDVERAASLMASKQIRRLPVLDHARRLVGIVSLGDLAVHPEARRLGETVLEDVSKPAEPKRAGPQGDESGFQQAA